MFIKRFNKLERLFHLLLVITFFIQTITGFSRLYITTPWGKQLSAFMGGYETSALIHHWGGLLMIAGFLVHIVYLLTKVSLKNPGKTIFGTNSLLPGFSDFRHLVQRSLWSVGLARQPSLNRWTYWEKFDYWAVFWGIPLLGLTGLMLMYPVATSTMVPGWSLNIATLLHKAEAILAVTYIFIVHFFMSHIRPHSFPMNETIFSGTVSIDEVKEEKPAWADEIQAGEDTNTLQSEAPSSRLKVIYYIFGLSCVGLGLYLLINGIIYSRYINLH